MVRVYIVNDSGHDFNQALEYSDAPTSKQAFVFLSKGTINVFHVDRVKAQMKSKLDSFCQDDILLLCGAVALNAIAVKLLSEKFKWFHVLIFDGRTRKYTKREI